MTKKVTVFPKRSAIGNKKAPAKGRSIAANIKIAGTRVAAAIRQNMGNITSGGIR